MVEDLIHFAFKELPKEPGPSLSGEGREISFREGPVALLGSEQLGAPDQDFTSSGTSVASQPFEPTASSSRSEITP